MGCVVAITITWNIFIPRYAGNYWGYTKEISRGFMPSSNINPHSSRGKNQSILPVTHSRLHGIILPVFFILTVNSIFHGSMLTMNSRFMERIEVYFQWHTLDYMRYTSCFIYVWRWIQDFMEVSLMYKKSVTWGILPILFMLTMNSIFHGSKPHV